MAIMQSKIMDPLFCVCELIIFSLGAMGSRVDQSCSTITDEASLRHVWIEVSFDNRNTDLALLEGDDPSE